MTVKLPLPGHHSPAPVSNLDAAPRGQVGAVRGQLGAIEGSDPQAKEVTGLGWIGRVLRGIVMKGRLGLVSLN